MRYLQQASAPRVVWLSRLLSVSEAMVGSLLGSVGSVDMDETSLAEDEEEDVGCGGLSITAAPKGGGCPLITPFFVHSSHSLTSL